jgi:8-oxo-dGTP diphosphatase
VVTLTGLLGVYSDPARDARRHTISTVFTARAENPGDLAAGDDAAGVGTFALDQLPDLVFDHARILGDYVSTLRRQGFGSRDGAGL